MPHATINGQDLYFEDSGGTGPVIVFSHGFLMDHEMFAPQLEALSGRYRVITWDERGFGRTRYDGRPFTYWDSAADVVALLDHLDIDRAVLAGMSQGGFLSLRAALSAPERVRALVLLDTQAGVEDAETQTAYQAMVDTWVAMGPIDELCAAVAAIIIADPEIDQRWIAKWKQLPVAPLAHAGACLLGRDDITGRLGEISCPAIVIHGLDDTAITMERAGQLAAGLVGAGPVVAVPGAHAANLTHPEPVNAAIIEFLEGLRGE